jgi:hypothetical protein
MVYQVRIRVKKVEFAKLLEHCFSLKFDDEPNYKYLIEMFQKLYTSKDYEFDYNYDWVTAVKDCLKIRRTTVKY